MEKKVGHCSCCGEKLWYIDVPPEDRSGMRATFMLADGSLLDLTLGNCCTESYEVEKIWRRVLDGWNFENAEAYATMQGRDNLILGCLYMMRWSEVY